MQWTRHQDPSGFTLEHPEGWRVERHPDDAVLVNSPDGRCLALIQRMPGPRGDLEDILFNGHYPTAYLFGGVKPTPVDSGNPFHPGGELAFHLPNGAVARARLTCASGPAGTMVLAQAAPTDDFSTMLPVLSRITESFERRSGLAALANPVMPAVPHGPPQALTFVPFTDPQAGTFTVEVPRGWQARGGFHHPGLGDRRPFVEVQSPEGALALHGDPNLPQWFYHHVFSPEGMPLTFPTGCTFVNLPPSGKGLATYYLQQIAAHRFGPIRITGHRDRKDILAEAKAAGFKPPLGVQLSIQDVQFEVGGRSGACLAFSTYNPMMDFGMGTTWEGKVALWLAPPALVQMAEQAANRLCTTFATTPRFTQIYQQDEMAIANGGAVALAGQQQWFAGQQAAYRDQQAIGDIITSTYNARQASEDHIFQGYSDAMLGKQRLYDDACGRPYEAAAGANYYWLDQASGQVVGTATNDPPDYQRNYTLLRRQ